MPPRLSAAPGMIALAFSVANAPALAEAPPRGGATAPAAASPAGSAAPAAPSPAGSAAPAAPSPAGSAAPAAPPPASAPRSPRSEAALRGAIVVAADDESAAAARSLARSLYRDPALRPPIDEGAAQALAGEPPPPDAPTSVKELAEVRRSVARAASEPVARGLLASLGASAGAALVVAVTTAQGHPVARVLRVAGASYAPLELGATVQRPQTAAAAPIFDWPSAAPSLRALLPDAGAAAGRSAGAAAAGAPQRGPARPLAPLASSGGSSPGLAAGDPTASERSSAWTGWKSPWFWGPLAGVVATGVAVLVLAHADDRDNDTLHLRGRIAP